MLVALAAAASAHAGLESSDPAAGELLAAPPASVMLAFTEPPDPDLSSVAVLDAQRRRDRDRPARTRLGAPLRARSRSRHDLGDGVYTVSWRVVSTADGHLTAGAFAFGVGVTEGEVAAVPEAPSTPSPSPLAVAGKVLLYAGLAVAVGTTASGVVAFGGVVPARRVLLPLAGASALVGAVAMTIAEADVVGASVGDLLSSAAGRSYVWLLGTTAVTLVASFVASRGLGPRPARRLRPGGRGGDARACHERPRGGARARAARRRSLSGCTSWRSGCGSAGSLPLLLLVRERAWPRAPAPVAEVTRFSRIAGWALLVVRAHRHRAHRRGGRGHR